VTRINIVDPEELADQHLVAEYREVFMVGSVLQRSLQSPHWAKNKKTWASVFKVNGGHVKFFYDKGKYLHNRHGELIAEMKRRGMNPDPARLFKRDQWPDELYSDWTPTESARRIVRQRIRERNAVRPGWYRWTKGFA